MNPKSLFPVDFVSHDVVEVIRCDKPVFVEISLAENVIDFIFSQVFSQFFGNFLEFVDCDFALS